MKATKTAERRREVKPAYLNVEINLDLRRELHATAKRHGEMIPQVLHRILCVSLDRMDLMEMPSASAE